MKNYLSYNIEKRIAQLIFPRLNVNQFEEKREYYRNLAELGVGGFCIFNGNMEKMREIVAYLDNYSEIPLLYCCDMENGMGMRFEEATIFPRAMAQGNTNNPGNAYITSKITSLEAKSCGIFWNLAPVVDININPNNPIINLRAYSDNPIVVSEFSKAYIDAANSERVISCIKHFPGHGDTDVDSHINVPILNKSIESLTQNELIPFFSAIKNGVPSIMVGHLAVQSIDDSCLPASLSEKIINKFLKEKLKYDGIIITDALEMQSVEKQYPNGEATFLALKAGADVLLMPEDPEIAYKYIISNINKIDLKAIETSFDKIIDNKRKCGLLDGILNHLPTSIDIEEHRLLALNMAKSTIKITPKDKIEDCKLEDEDSFLLISILLDDRNLEKAIVFMKLLQSKTINNCDSMFINNEIDGSAVQLLTESEQNHNKVLIAIYQSPSSYSLKKALSQELINIINNLTINKFSIILNFAPENASNLLNYQIKIDTFSDDYNSMNAVADLISGNDEEYNFVSNIKEAKKQRKKLEKENLKN